MGPIAAIGSVYGRYFQFSGRASRSEFWWFVLFYTLMLVGLVTLDVWLFLQNPELLANPWLIDPLSFFSLYFVVLSVVPYWAVVVRRLHDAGFSGFWVLLAFVPALCAAVGVPFQIYAMLTTGSTPPFVSILNAVSMLSQLGFLVLLAWPGDRDDNIYGPPWQPLGGRKRRVSGSKELHDPMQGYANFIQSQMNDSPEMRAAKDAARKEEVRRLYQERVLGQAS